VYRALVEATAFGTRTIIDAHVRAGIAATELYVCGGLTQDPGIMQVYADVTGLPVKVAASSQAVALGAAIFGALAADDDGVETDRAAAVEATIARMTRPPAKTYSPDAAATAVYDRLYDVYRHAHDHFGRDHPSIMKSLKEIRKESLRGQDR
jgi:L-ribulokinase